MPRHRKPDRLDASKVAALVGVILVADESGISEPRLRQHLVQLIGENKADSLISAGRQRRAAERDSEQGHGNNP